MQYDHEGVEITLLISAFQTSQLIEKTTSENFIIVHLVVWAERTIEFNRINSCCTMGNSADLCCDFANSYFIRNMSVKESR